MEIQKRPYSPNSIKRLRASQPGAIAQATAELKAGRLVVIPTDTLYGLAGEAFNPAALRAIYAAKQRPTSKPLPILLADAADLPRLVRAVPTVAQHLIDRHWPGPLTLVLPKHPTLPAEISNNDSVAVRIPDNDVGRSVIRAAGGALAVTSANLTGQSPAQTAAEAVEKLAGWVTAVVDDGPSPQAVASTILDCTGPEPKILREGPIAAHLLLNLSRS